MKAQDLSFTKLINGTTQFLIPVFQRDYSWGEDEWAKLWNDVIRATKVNSEHGHFLGSIVYLPSGRLAAGFTQWLVVDGQQRLATLTILLIALRDHIKEISWVSDENGPTPQKIDAYFLKNVQESGNRRPKLVLRRADNDTLKSLVDGDDRPESYSDAVISAYEYFRDLLKTQSPDLVYEGIGKLIIIDVTLDRHGDDPQMVFESLNSTGIDLSESDLIRNYVLMSLSESEQTRMYEQYWNKIETLFRGSENILDNFIRDYMALRTKSTKQTKADQIYHVFRDEFAGLKEEDEGLEGFLQNIVQAARWYAAFILGSGGDNNLNKALKNVRRLAPASATLVTKLYQCHDEAGSLSSNDFIIALQLLESYVLRRAICGLDTRAYWTVFTNIAHKIEIDNPLLSYQVELVRQRETYRFPSDKEFYQGIFAYVAASS